MRLFQWSRVLFWGFLLFVFQGVGAHADGIGFFKFSNGSRLTYRVYDSKQYSVSFSRTGSTLEELKHDGFDLRRVEGPKQRPAPATSTELALRGLWPAVKIQQSIFASDQKKMTHF